MSEKEKHDLGLDRQKDLDTELKDMLEDIQSKGLDKWENIRGPRPWEDPKKMQEDQRKTLSLNGGSPEKQNESNMESR